MPAFDAKEREHALKRVSCIATVCESPKGPVAILRLWRLPGYQDGDLYAVIDVLREHMRVRLRSEHAEWAAGANDKAVQ